jgi:hypothetical protein
MCSAEGTRGSSTDVSPTSEVGGLSEATRGWLEAVGYPATLTKRMRVAIRWASPVFNAPICK